MSLSTSLKLPAPPSHKKGWPWTTPSFELQSEIADEFSWPMISIVTPSFNQGKYIEETIRSVLLQEYPNVEYIIIDGGSSDNTLKILMKYEKWITHWVSEADNGQSHAINKGFTKASGEIYAYINSDDFYEPNAFRTIALLFNRRQNIQLIAGGCSILEQNTIKTNFNPWWPKNLDHFLKPFGSTFAQPASFWTKSVYDKVGGFNENSHFCFDREFFLKIGLLGIKPYLTDENLAFYRDHENTKTNKTIRFYEETVPLIKKYSKKLELAAEIESKILNDTKSEIKRINVFITWKNQGRISALIDFFKIISKEPKLLFKRKIFGLFRRLLFFKEKNVIELANV